MNATNTATMTSELTPKSAATTIQVSASSTPVPLPTMRSSPTGTLSPTPIDTSTLTATPFPTIQPVIHEQPGDLYETLFSIPVGPNNIIQYKVSSIEIEGPNAIAILPDESFMIADPVSNRLLHFDQEGSLLNIIELENLGIRIVVDLRAKGSELYFIETGRGPDSQKKYWVHRLSTDGMLIGSDEIPYRFPIDANKSENTIESGLTGIAIDCEGRIILEVTGGSRLFPLSEVQKQPNPANITQGLLCNGKRYAVNRSGPWTEPQVSAGDKIYQTRLTYGLGGLHFIDVFQDGSIYIVRDDVVTDPVITVDQTVHYIGADGAVIGVARIPLSEFYYPIMRKVAINSKGEAFVLLPRPDSLDIVRLNFYESLPPLIDGAAKPEITIVADQ